MFGPMFDRLQMLQSVDAVCFRCTPHLASLPKVSVSFRRFRLRVLLPQLEPSVPPSRRSAQG